jgi:membrane associated rhomboid family serine protease
MGSATTLKIWREQSLLHKLIYDWIFVPIGVAIIIGIVIAVNQLFKAIGFNFPANVAGMLLVAIVFIILEYTIPKYAMDKILMCINPAIDFLM